jgi:nitroreductase
MDSNHLEIEVTKSESIDLNRIKRADTSAPIIDVLAERWSPRAWQDRPVEDAKLVRMFEAARWAASSGNEQSWRFLISRRHFDASWDDALACLDDGNQEWAYAAPVLVITAAASTTSRGRPYKHAWHDLGLAMGNLCAQATADGLHVHQMGGILPEEVRVRFGVPQDFDVVTAATIGYLGDPDTLSERRRKTELEPRTRRPLEETLFTGAWNTKSPILKHGSSSSP